MIIMIIIYNVNNANNDDTNLINNYNKLLIIQLIIQLNL